MVGSVYRGMLGSVCREKEGSVSSEKLGSICAEYPFNNVTLTVVHEAPLSVDLNIPALLAEIIVVPFTTIDEEE